MNKLMQRMLCLLLALLLTLPLAACGNSGDDRPSDQSGEASESEAESAGPPIEKKKYNRDFNVIFCNDTFPQGYFFVLDEERQPGNDMDDAVYERMLKVNDHLGVTIKPTNGGIFTEYSAPIKRTVSAGDDEYQMIMTHTYYDVSNMIIANYFRDFKDFENINTDRPYWDQKMMEEDSLDDHYFLGYNDFCLASVYVLAFNKMLAKQFTEMDGIYDLVRNKQWTMEKLFEFSRLVSADNGDGKWDENDTYGFAGLNWVPMVSFTTAAGIRVIDKDDTGELYLAPVTDNQERMISLTSMLFNFAKEDCTYLWNLNGGSSLGITSNRVLFQMTNNYSLLNFVSEEVPFGVLPYPMYDEHQDDYYVMNWNGMLAIPASVRDDVFVGDAFEMMAYYSDPVKTAFFERLLGARVADAPDDAEMLSIIWSHQTNDVGMIFSSSSQGLEELFYVVPRLIMAGNDGYMAFYKARSKQIDKGLQKIYQKLRGTK